MQIRQAFLPDRLRRPQPWLRAVVAALALVAGAGAQAQTSSLTVSAVVLSKSNCKFQNAKNLSMAFGVIDPASSADVTRTISTTVICHGSANVATFLVEAESGLHYGNGSRRMQRVGSSPAEYMAYSLSINPASATVNKNVPLDIEITGTITPAAFQNASAGNYSDTVRITLTP